MGTSGTLAKATNEVLEFLRIALEVEQAAHRGSLAERLTDCLTRWQQLDVCSFATAFIIQGNEIAKDSDGSFCVYPDAIAAFRKHKLYAFFELLTSAPKPTRGRWPWVILRESRTVNDEGMFPAKVLSLNSISLPAPSWADKQLLEEAIDRSFQSISESDRDDLCWQWYAQYPALLGDAIRDDRKKTCNVLYILGTRREFARAGIRQRDYGLIVGLTNQLQDADLKDAELCVLAAWNVMVVAQHILDDAARIGTLESARSLTHTFRTFIEASVLPRIETTTTKMLGTSNAEQLVQRLKSHVAEAGHLAAFMAFVARGGIRFPDASNLESHVETAFYSPVQVIAEEFNEAAQMPHDTKLTVKIANPPDVSVRFARKLYLRAICQELLKNIRDHGQPDEENSVAVQISFTNDGDVLTVSISNPAKPPKKAKSQLDTGVARNQVRGLGALDAMLEACGGSHHGDFVDEEAKWQTELKLDCSFWKEVPAKEGPSETLSAKDISPTFRTSHVQFL